MSIFTQICQKNDEKKNKKNICKKIFDVKRDQQSKISTLAIIARVDILLIAIIAKQKLPN
jgi:hypothetical protein